MSTERLIIDAHQYSPEVLQPAVGVLRDGGLVAFPTETVYGVGAAFGNAVAIERLRALKERPNEPFTLHISTLEQFMTHVPQPGELARRMISRFWPGPLTLVLPTANGSSIGLRMPGARLTADLITLTGPLWVPSANPRDKAPARTAQQVLDYFEGRIDMVVDGGEPVGKPSTVLRVSDDKYEILREGDISREMLDRVARRFVLFVCTGNTCRSPLAEVLMKQVLAERLKVSVDELPEAGYLIESAGTMAGRGLPASTNSVQVADELGCDLHGHRSNMVTFDLLLEADLILTMTSNHLRTLVELMPECRDRAFPLDPQGHDISDPVGGSVEVYRHAAAQIREGIVAAITRFGII